MKQHPLPCLFYYLNNELSLNTLSGQSGFIYNKMNDIEKSKNGSLYIFLSMLRATLYFINKNQETKSTKCCVSTKFIAQFQF